MPQTGTVCFCRCYEHGLRAMTNGKVCSNLSSNAVQIISFHLVATQQITSECAVKVGNQQSNFYVPSTSLYFQLPKIDYYCYSSKKFSVHGGE